jgi:pSer/pThr/pTyr-binding forkhead associated (FHA) protein
MGLLKTKRNGQLVAYRLDKAAVIVGSGEACNIRVPDMGLVARHCQILKMENGFVLRDMSGDVGTFVNGKKVKEHLLSDRDLIQVGKERFTFSISEGENTARVAVSVAPAAAPARSGATARVAAAPPARSGSTQRVAAPAAAEAPRKTERTEMAARTTSRMAPPAEGGGRSTQRVNKGTQRMGGTGGTKKITARTAAGMGYQTSKTTFAMPSTRKGKLIAIGGVLFILALGGGLYLIKAGQVDPDKVRAEMNAELADIKKFKPEQVLEIDKALGDILSKHEPNKSRVLQRYSEIEREYKKVHAIAEDLRKANKEVLPFFARYAAVKAKPEDYKTQAQALYDECKSISDNFGGGAHGPRLTEILTELKKVLEEKGSDTWRQHIIQLQADVQKGVSKGECAPALKVVNEFGEKWKEKDDIELIGKLKDERDKIKRQSDAFVNREVGKAQKELAAEGAKKDEIKKRLEAFKPGLEGYPEALQKLENFIVTIK